MHGIACSLDNMFVTSKLTLHKKKHIVAPISFGHVENSITTISFERKNIKSFVGFVSTFIFKFGEIVQIFKNI